MRLTGRKIETNPDIAETIGTLNLSQKNKDEMLIMLKAASANSKQLKAAKREAALDKIAVSAKVESAKVFTKVIK